MSSSTLRPTLLWTRAESEPDFARLLNATARRGMALEGTGAGCPGWCDYSTDYVFDGRVNGPGKRATTGPLSTYGRTKLEGEQAAGPANAT